MYKPNPIDTSDINLSEDIQSLVEKIAENAHEIWAAQRIKEGWVYGAIRDDSLKQSPWLIPYCDLPENEKEYDRLIAIENIKTILSLGYEIRK